MKKITYTLLMAALVCGLSLGITSCKDDDKDDSGDDGQEQLSEEQQEQNNAAYAILDNLADLSSANDNFLTQTFEPTIGTADDGDCKHQRYGDGSHAFCRLGRCRYQREHRLLYMD